MRIVLIPTRPSARPQFPRRTVRREAQLLRHDSAIPCRPDRRDQPLDRCKRSSFKFDLPDTARRARGRLTVEDVMALDNRAFTLIGNPRKAQVLVVTEGNRYLVDTLKTPTAEERADVLVVTPAELKADTLARDVKSGRFDLVIYDRFRPEIAPEANALYFGVLPPGKLDEKSKNLEPPIVVLDTNISHPMMQFIRDLPTVRIIKAIGVEPPPGSATLIESNQGPLAFVAPRDGYTDTVVTFAMLREGNELNSGWQC